MKKQTLLLLMVLIPLITRAQFEQKLSINLSAGTFKPIGTKTFLPEWASEDEREPLQMPNYRQGVLGNVSFQFNINRHLSVDADLGIIYSGQWYYNIYDDVNYLDFAIYDSITDELLADGSDELTIMNISLGLAPRYYLLPGKKINPYIFAGLSINYTKCEFNDNQWQAYHDLGMLEPDDSGPSNDYLEKNVGFGLYPGIGAEYTISDNIGIFISAGYYLILLKKENFKTTSREENFNSVNLQAGIRLSFLKSKNL